MSHRKRIVVFGELLMRLAPRGVSRLVQADEFIVRYTGAEANVGVSLVNFGMDTFAVSKVPDGEIGQACINYLRRFGVNTDHIARGGGRLGLFYLERGAAQRPSKVIYDREHSAIRESTPEEYDWNAILAGKDWFHFSGTAPALGHEVQVVLEQGLKTANRLGVTVSCDLNYRARLWKPAEANRVMTPLMSYVDVLFGNEEDAELVFNLKAPGSSSAEGVLPYESYVEVAEQLVRRYGFKQVATTLRKSISASSNGWSALLYDGAKAYLSRNYHIDTIVDRVGAGDSFAAGVIYALLSGFDPQRCIDFATAASCLKHSIPGDFNLVTVDEVERCMGGGVSGRIQR